MEWKRSYTTEMDDLDRMMKWFQLGVLLCCMISYVLLAFTVKRHIEIGKYEDAVFYFMISQIFLTLGMKQIKSS